MFARIKPFSMFGIAYLFFYVVFKAFIPAGLAEEYLAGAVLLGAALATVVGVLIEVQVMLMLVRIANNTRSWFLATK